MRGQSTGLLVPFACVQVRLLDASTLEQLAIGQARQLWSTLPDNEKVTYLSA